MVLLMRPPFVPFGALFGLWRPRFVGLLGLAALVLSGCLWATGTSFTPCAWAYDNRIAPPFLHYEDLHTFSELPHWGGRINLNTAPLHQLLSLPEVDEPTALLIMANRPYLAEQGLQKLNGQMPAKRLAQLQFSVAPRVVFTAVPTLPPPRVTKGN